MSVFSALQKNILLTLAYTDQFEFPLREHEVWQRLPQAAKKEDVKKALTSLVEKKVLFEKLGFFSLCDRQELYHVRHSRRNLSQAYQADIATFISVVRKIPWVMAVFITGSLAMENARCDDDIDFMIITLPGRLWLSRFIITGVSWLLGKKRQRGEVRDGTAHKWCLNLWLDLDHLQVPEHKHSLYQAYEVMQAKIVWERAQGARRFQQKNKWVEKWLPNWKVPKEAVDDVALPPNQVWSVLDYLSFQFQKAYMSAHHTSEKIERGFAFFHPRKTEKIIYQRWLRSLRVVDQKNIDTIHKHYDALVTAKKTARAA